MIPALKGILLGTLLFWTLFATSQQKSNDPLKNILSYNEYIGYVKSYHPLMKQADLRLTEGEAALLKSRGGFDPKIEVDYDRKQFKNTEYWDVLNSTFKVPTWYGLEFKANFEQNSGEFLNPELSVPEEGLYSVGVTLDIARDFLINDRMADLRKARFFQEQTQAERDLLLNDLIFEATKAYLDWIQAHNAEMIFDQFLDNAKIRFEGVKRSVEAGAVAAIDSTEARIAYQNRQLQLEAARLNRLKAALKASNYLWLNDIPLEIQPSVVPELPNAQLLTSSLVLEGITDTQTLLEEHPKLRSMQAKIGGLEVERSLKRNKLLPRLQLEYNFLTETPDNLNTIQNSEYKGGIRFEFPLFLRKERGDVRLANVKLQNANLDRLETSLVLQNKITAANQEIASLDYQQSLISDIVVDYQRLVQAEERKFELGESSLFLINARESKLIEASLKQNELQVKALKATAGLYNALGLTL